MDKNTEKVIKVMNQNNENENEMDLQQGKIINFRGQSKT